MSNDLSQNIVNFIGHLLPLYVEDEVEGMWCARSLMDGTLILPVTDADQLPEGFVKVRWQGDPMRCTEVQGVYMASVAITRYVELHHTASHSKAQQNEMEHMSHHFTVKTGEYLVFESPESGLVDVLTQAVGKLGEAAVIELLKKQVGL